MSETPELLPLGSAVMIDDDDGTYVIIARAFLKSAEGFLVGYKGVRHPVGSAAGVRDIVIRQSQITEVLHRGYENPDDALFAKKQLENAKAPPAEKATVAEPDLTIDLSKPATRVPTPVRPKADAAAPSGVVSNPKDPFSELRSRGKGQRK